MTRIVIAGSRGFSDYERLCFELDQVISGLPHDAELVSGHAKGADLLAERYAAERAIPITVMKPDWSRYGRGAGLVRNRQMLDYAAEASPIVVAFWDGKSTGTKNTIDTARKRGIQVLVFKFT